MVEPADGRSKGRKGRRSDGYSCYRRKDGRWAAAVVVGTNAAGNPSRKCFYGRTRTEALEAARRFKASVDAGSLAPVSRETSLAEWLGLWLEEIVRPAREPKTYDYYAGFVRNHIVPALGRRPLRRLNMVEVQGLLNAMTEKGLSASTVRGARATLRSALTQAWRAGLVEQNAAARTAPPKSGAAPPVHLSAGQAKAFLDSLEDEPLCDLFRFAVATGVRLGEATGLRWRDVDFARGTVTVERQLQRVAGRLVLKDLKSQASRRRLPLEGLAERALEGRAQAAERPEPDGLVFLNAEGRPIDPKHANDRLRRALERAGLPPVSFHKLRHTAATLMVASGVPLHSVMRQLGHSQVSLTAQLYAQRVDEAQRAAVRSLDEVLRTGAVNPR